MVDKIDGDYLIYIIGFGVRRGREKALRLNPKSESICFIYIELLI